MTISLFSPAQRYIWLLLFHALLGWGSVFWPFLTTIWGFLAAIVGLVWIVTQKNDQHQVIIAGAYLTGSEVFLRMTGFPSHEFVKYVVIIYFLLGLIYSGFSKNALVYGVYLLLLIPGIIWATQVLDLTLNVRKSILFNMTGPVGVGIGAWYCYQKTISWERFQQVLMALSIPMVACLVYVTIYSPTVQEVVTGTNSNNMLSGGYGPNQVATLLGLAAFCFFAQWLLYSSNRWLWLINGGLFCYTTYRGLITFSRGGIYTALIVIAVLLVVTYRYLPTTKRFVLAFFAGLVAFCALAVWTYSSLQTAGMLDKRYANQDSLGREKSDLTTGRWELATEEINLFLENPFLGVGAAKGTQLRSERMGLQETVASHNECTRLLAEHGLFGLIDLVILLVIPILLQRRNPANLFRWSCFLFWLLSVNHSAMRTFSPAFMYGLCVLILPIPTKKSDTEVDSLAT